MKLNSYWILSLGILMGVLACGTDEVTPEPPVDPVETTPPTTGTPPTDTTATDSTTVTPPVNPPVTPPPPASRPAFLPEHFDESPACLLSKVYLEANTAGNIVKTTNVYQYDAYNRFTEIKSTTEGVAGAAITSYVYKDAEKKIEVTYTGFQASDNYAAVALLNDDYTIKEIAKNGSGETSKTTFTYNGNGEVISQVFDSNLKSYEIAYTYGAKGIIKSERKNYVFKAAPAPEKEEVVLEWTYGDVSSEGYNSLVLSDPNFPTGYLGKLTNNLPVQSKVYTAARISTPIAYEYSSNSVTNYTYTNNSANKVVRIDTDSNANSSGFVINVKTKIELEYK